MSVGSFLLFFLFTSFQLKPLLVYTFLLIPLFLQFFSKLVIDRLGNHDLLSLLAFCTFDFLLFILMCWNTILIKFTILGVFFEHLLGFSFHLNKIIVTFCSFYSYFFFCSSSFLRLASNFCYLYLTRIYLFSNFHVEG